MQEKDIFGQLFQYLLLFAVAVGIILTSWDAIKNLVLVDYHGLPMDLKHNIRCPMCDAKQFALWKTELGGYYCPTCHWVEKGMRMKKDHGTTIQ